MPFIIKQSALIAILATFHLAQALPTLMGILPPSTVATATSESSETGHVPDYGRRDTVDIDPMLAPRSPIEITVDTVDTTLEQEPSSDESPTVKKRAPKKENKTKGYGTAPDRSQSNTQGGGGCGAGTCIGGGSLKPLDANGNAEHRGAGHFKKLVGQGGYYGKKGVKPAKGASKEGYQKAKEHPYTGPPGVRGHGR